MELTTELVPVDAISQELGAELGVLGAAVYPPQPAGSPPHPSHAIEWAGPDILATVRTPDGRLGGVGGALIREVQLDGTSFVACGIGGMQTHPEMRRRGIARRAISELLQQGRDRGALLGILFCRDELLPLYGGLGWQRYDGRVLAVQHGEHVTFDFNNAMTISLDGVHRHAEVMDVRGTPW